MKASLGTSSLPGSPSSFPMSFTMNRVNPSLCSRSPLSGAPILQSSSHHSLQPSTSHEDLDDRVTQPARSQGSPNSVTVDAHSPGHENSSKSLNPSNLSISVPSTVADENERPDGTTPSGSNSSEPETAQSDGKSRLRLPCLTSDSHAVDTTKPVCFNVFLVVLRFPYF